MSEIIAIDKEYVAGTYARFPVQIEKGKGSVVFSPDGKRYIDMGSGIGVTAFGISDDEWVKAVTDQLACVQHMSNLYYTSPCARLAQLLCEKTGMKKVFFSNSGAEANECAIKVARKYAAENKSAEHNVIVTLNHSFHGRTLTTLAATGQEHYHELFQPLTPGFVHVDAGDMAQLEDVVKNYKVAGMLIECIQGEGGVIPLDGEYIKAAYELCKKEDIIFMVDEVQTGNGRTGKFYAYMNYGISPDVVTTAKGLGGGLPIGACLMSEKVQNVLGFGDHGSTYGGNPVCCAGAVSVVERIDEDLLNEVSRKSKFILDSFNGAKGVSSVSGLGFMIGILPESANASDVVKKCIERGVLCLTAKNKVRLLPALNISDEILYEAVEIIKEVIAELS